MSLARVFKHGHCCTLITHTEPYALVVLWSLYFGLHIQNSFSIVCVCVSLSYQTTANTEEGLIVSTLPWAQYAS